MGVQENPSYGRACTLPFLVLLFEIHLQRVVVMASPRKKRGRVGTGPPLQVMVYFWGTVGEHVESGLLENEEWEPLLRERWQRGLLMGYGIREKRW